MSVTAPSKEVHAEGMAESMTVPEKQTRSKARLNLNLTGTAREEVDRLAEETSRSITELVRLALSLLKVIVDERKAGNKLIVTRPDGTPLKELVLPGF